MSMKNVQPINPDTLIAMHAIRLSQHGELKDDLLASILWGELAFGHTGEQEGVQRMLTPPISDVVTVLQTHGLGVLPCFISLAKEEADFYRKAAGMQKRLKTGDSKDRGTLSKILKGLTVETTLIEGASVISLLLAERKKALGTFETFFTAAAFQHPININFEADPQHVEDILKAALHTYLSAFKAGRIAWDTNAKKWAENRKRMVTMLGHYESYDTAWMTDEEIDTKYSTWGCDHPIETLLTLMMEDVVAVESIAADGESGLRFWVKASGLPALAGEANFRNLRTEKMMIWNTENPKLRERFNEGWLYLLWLYLLDHIDKKLLREDIARHLEEAMPDKGKVNLDKIFEGLIQKLQNVTGEPREALDDWFEKDSKHLFLKSE